MFSSISVELVDLSSLFLHFADSSAILVYRTNTVEVHPAYFKQTKSISFQNRTNFQRLCRNSFDTILNTEDV